MSRVGQVPITIPNTVEVTFEGDTISIKGPKGNLQAVLHPSVKVEQEDKMLVIKRKKENQIGKSMHGTLRTVLQNMVVGVTDGWTKGLEMVGVGYRAQGGGETITLNVGFSHPVQIKAPEGISFAISDNTKISVSGIDKILVGQIAANIRAVKPPEVYKGKGIRYVGEYVRRKAGKAGKAGAK